MVPIPETVLAIEDLDRVEGFDPVVGELCVLAEMAQEVVPDLVGVSLARLAYGLTFTVVASAQEIAVLDGIQYLAGGPCVAAAHINRPVGFDNEDPLDEDRWRLFAQATAAHTVRTTLTLPMMNEGRALGTVNLYAASQRAFVGHHDELAEIFGAWAAGAVANADLAFTTRREAQAAPGRVRKQFVIDMAYGLTAAQLDIGVEAAEARMQDAAVRAGVSLSQLAQAIVAAHEAPERDED